MELFIAMAILLGVYEIARTAVLYKRIHQPIRRYVRTWKRYNKRKSSIANPSLSLYRYAYSQLSTDQLKHVKLSLESEKSQSAFILILDLILKIFLPIAAFFIGFVTAISNNYTNLGLKQQNMTAQPIVDVLNSMTIETINTLLIPILLIVGTILLVAMGHLLYKNIRDHVVTKLVGLVDQLLSEDASAKNLFKSGTFLVDEEDFRSAAFFHIPVSVWNDNQPVSRGIIRKTSFVSVTIDRQGFEKETFMFRVI